jgi:hypothetical protein
VTVGAQETQVRKLVVLVVPVDMVEFEGNRQAQPLGETAASAGSRQETSSQETSLQLEGLDRCGILEIGGEWLFWSQPTVATPRSSCEL